MTMSSQLLSEKKLHHKRIDLLERHKHSGYDLALKLRRYTINDFVVAQILNALIKNLASVQRF